MEIQPTNRPSSRLSLEKWGQGLQASSKANSWRINSPLKRCQLFCLRLKLVSTPDLSSRHLTQMMMMELPHLLLLTDQVTKAPTSTLKRWQLCQALTQHFWKRWSTEYLNDLQRFNKWRRPKRCLRVNDIVLIKDNRTPPCQWPLGRIIRTHPGPDQLVRVVTVKTKTGTFVRPIVKLCLLAPSEGAQ